MEGREEVIFLFLLWTSTPSVHRPASRLSNPGDSSKKKTWTRDYDCCTSEGLEGTFYTRPASFLCSTQHRWAPGGRWFTLPKKPTPQRVIETTPLITRWEGTPTWL